MLYLLHLSIVRYVITNKICTATPEGMSELELIEENNKPKQKLLKQKSRIIFLKMLRHCS